MQWIALHLPSLPLEALLRGSRSPEAWAIVEHGTVLRADRKASLRGIAQGMRTTAALAVAPQLRLVPRDAVAETEALLGLAGWCVQFTPKVAPRFPEALLLEVSGSLKLFGGLVPILDALTHGLARQGFTATIAVASTAEAALWLARAGRADIVDGNPRSAIETLPLAVLRLDDKAVELLERLGIRTIGELMTLPRDGMARRFGPTLPDILERALGHQDDACSFFSLPPRFAATLELPAEAIQSEALLFAAQRLLVQLEGYLTARSAGVQSFTLRLFHRGRQPTLLGVGLVNASRNAAHFAQLLRERLGSTNLRAPVHSISLEAERIEPFAGTTLGLLPDDRNGAGEWERLIERLRSRFATEAVAALKVTADHRPERASCLAAPEGKQLRLELTPDHRPGERPFWLLDTPRPIEEIGNVPHYEGPLALLSGPERIESGWWDGADVKRDYFVARNNHDALFWIYRERGSGWYLHGIFA